MHYNVHYRWASQTCSSKQFVSLPLLSTKSSQSILAQEIFDLVYLMEFAPGVQEILKAGGRDWKHLFDVVEPFFPTCQVRVVRFYESCSPHPPPPPRPPPPSPPPRPPPLLPPLPPLPRPLLPCQLLAKLFANFGAQCALLDLNLGPSQLSAHRWTSTWDLPSSVRTAGPQPGTRAQCAPLDLNLGPSELSVHRWTSKARWNARRYAR